MVKLAPQPEQPEKVIGIRQWIIWAGASGLAFLLIVALLSSRYYAVEITVNASVADHIRVYWAPDKTPFAEGASRAVSVKQGEQRYQFLMFSAHRPNKLLIKAGSKIEALSLREVRFKRLGRQDGVLVGTALVQRIRVLSGELDLQQRKGEVTLTSKEKKLSVSVDHLENGERHTPWLMIISILLCIALLVMLCRRCVFARQQDRTLVKISVFLISLAWFVAILIHSLSFEVLVSLRALSIVLAMLLLWLNKDWLLRVVRGARLTTVLRLLPLPLVFFALIFWIASNQFSWFTGFDFGSLASRAEFAQSKQQFEAKLKDWFLHKSPFIRLNSEVKGVSLLGTSPTAKVILGRQGFMFEGRGERRVEGNDVREFDNISDYLGRNSFTEAELKQWATVLQDRHDWLKARDVPYLFVMAPTKAMIYAENLPWMLRNIENVRRRYDVLYGLSDRAYISASARFTTRSVASKKNT